MFDTIIIGGGPAGLSAAITARQRGMDAVVVSNDSKFSGLYKAAEVRNYPGFPVVSGAGLLESLAAHAQDMGAELIIGKVSTIMSAEGLFYAGYGSEIIQAKTLVLATGVAQSSMFPGEERLLGKGVSYCATCDGMLYRGKRICVVCLSPEAGSEADYLSSIGCDVLCLEGSTIKHGISINGDERVVSVTADGKEIECSGVFIFRKVIAPNLLLPNLTMQSGHIKAERMGETSIPGVFAAGDCVGEPYQIAKAVGEGLKAALAADEYVAKKGKL